MGPVRQSRVFPPWAQRAHERAQRNAKAGPDLLSKDGVEIQSLSPDQAMAYLLEARGTFSRFRDWDENPEYDQALGEKGRVVTRYGTAEYSGDPKNGQLVLEGEDRASKLVLRGAIAESVRVNKDGRLQVLSLDLSPGGKSRRLRTSSPESEGPPKSEHAQAVRNGAEALKELPGDSPEGRLRKLFLDRSESLREVRSEVLASIRERAASLSDELLHRLLKNPHAHTPRNVHDRILALKKDAPGDPELQKLGEEVGWWQVLEDFPRLHADGLMRTTEYYVTPQVLQLSVAAQGWEIDEESGLPVADSVVVGGGPGGLATAYHLSENGHRTLVFEEGSVGQSFADSHAKSVHQLRTDEDSTDLIYTPDHRRFGVDVSLGRQGHHLQREALQARDDWYESQGETPHGFLKPDLTTSLNPVSRAEFFGHMAQLADGLAMRYPDTFVCEKSPVTSLEKVERNGETLVKLTTSRGHQVLTRSLVMATGFVGGMGEHARALEQFSDLEKEQPDLVAVLGSDHDLLTKNDKLSSHRLVFSDRLLGRPEIRDQVKQLPEGSRVAFIGGGESAVKGALEVLHSNPGVGIDLYTSKPLEPYQTQVPAHILDSSSVELALRDPEFAEQTLGTLEGFGTPITTESLRELLKWESEGRVRVREMGKRFTSDTVEVTAGNGGFELALRDPEVKAALREQRESWKSQGMYASHPTETSATELPCAQMVVMAAGYDTQAAVAGPLIDDLCEAGLVELEKGRPVLSEDGTSSAKNPLLAFNTAAVVAMGADTTLHGRAVRAYRLAESFRELLPERQEPENRIRRKLPFGTLPTDSEEELWTRPQDLKNAREALQNGNWSNELIAFHQDRIDRIQDPKEKAEAQLVNELRRAFPGQNRSMVLLARRAEEFPDSLIPAEKLLLKRAFEISGRTQKPLEMNEVTR